MTEVWVVMAGDVLYASRPTKAEVDRVVAEQRELIEKFGTPRVEQRVVELRR